MHFDGSTTKVGVGVGVYVISPIRDFKGLSYKITFECTNNVAEYEALLLGLHSLKDMGAKIIQVIGDSELVINQVNDNYQTRHLRMIDYINEVWDMFGNYYTKHTIIVVPRYENTMANSFVVVDSKFKTPTASQRKYKVDIVNRPSIPDSSKY